ncbi:MAG: tetratricopeptide repeat protein, partial [Anaerolineae bacterium]|nr:tetratricopeptide repeat protein [Anaerolineae bacterium]
EIIDAAAAGRGQLLVITGEAGVGKSRLLEEVIALAREKPMVGIGGNCLSYGSQSPYLPWIDFFNAFFGLKQSEQETVEERIARIEQKMTSADPALSTWVPLVGQLVGLPVPDNELTTALDAQLRKQRTFDITLTLLRHQAQQTALFLIVFEDIHWIDTISLEMLNHVARNIAGSRILLVALHRPTVELAEWKLYPYHHEIALADLPAEDAIRLIRYKLGMAELPDPLRALALRGEERINPFFIEEVINSLIDRGYLVPQPEGGGYALVGDLSQVEVPDSIQTLVMSRIDRLDESSKLTVKVASVIGRTFRYRTLFGSYPTDIAEDRLHTNLERLSTLDLTPLDRPAPEWEYIFKHVTTQEVAYESLLYAHRRGLHHRVAGYLEQTYAGSLAEYYELLAHHYYQSGDKEKSWVYLVRAGHDAREKYANEAAIAHYSRALSLELGAPDTYLVYESMGDVYRLTGQYQKAFESYQAALTHHPPAVTHQADVQRKIAKVWELQGQYEEATYYLAAAQATLVHNESSPEMARVLDAMGWLAAQKGDLDHALHLCTKGLQLSHTLPYDEPSQKVRSELHHTMGTVLLRKGDYDEAVARFQESITTREEIGDLYGMSRSYNNLAVVYWSQSNYDLTARYLQESLKIHQKIGNTYGIAMTLSNLGVLYYTLGDCEQAISYYEHSLTIRREIGDAQGIADVYNNLGEVHHSLGDHSQALYYLEHAVQMYTQIGNREATFDVNKLLASVNLEMGHIDEALSHCQDALYLAEEIGNREYEGVAHRVLGQIYRLAAQQGEARQHLEESLETLLHLGNKLELGRSHYELGLTLTCDEPHTARSHLQHAAQIFEELGVETEREKALAALAGLP